MQPIEREMVSGSAVDVAPWLLNKVLVSEVGNRRVAGRIVEVEAYTQDDPASHSYSGRTARNAAMFGPPGHLYVYLIYGMHFCANVVTGGPGSGQAVLLRAVEPIAGVETMLERRGRHPLTDGPGKLCKAFGIDNAADGLDLCVAGAVWIGDDGVASPTRPIAGPRVGIAKAVNRPWRWRIDDKSRPK